MTFRALCQAVFAYGAISLTAGADFDLTNKDEIRRKSEKDSKDNRLDVAGKIGKSNIQDVVK